MSTPMEVDSEEMKDPVEPQAKSVFDMIIVIRDLLPRLTSNKNQCKRIADRFNTISDEAMKSMEVHEDSELFKILKRGQILVQGYADTTDITAREISNGDNRDEFKEFHEELHYAWAKLGFCWSLPRVEKSDLHDDAEMDMKAIKLRMNESISQSPADEGLKKRAQVVLEKSKSNIDEENMPSYLAIECKSSDVVIDEVPVEPEPGKMLSEMQFGNELPSHLAIDRKSSTMKIDDKRACREYERRSKQDPENEVGWVVVRPGKWLGCKFAFKVFKCNAAGGMAFKWNKQELLKEARSLVALQHPHVVRFVGFGHDEESCLFVMEWMDGDLKNFMKNNPGGFKERDVINQIAKGMHYMHKRGYAHGDLKCTNIMAKKLDKLVVQVKIGDLRGSQKLGEWDPAAFEAASKRRRPRWTAPEAIANYGGKEQPTAEQLKQSDVYSFGMTCYEIVTGKLPFHGKFDGPLLEYIQEGRVEKFNALPEELDEDLKGMIRKCWSKEPSDRPTFAEICLLLKTEPDRGSCCKDTAKMLLRQFFFFSERRSSTSSSGTRPPAPPPQVPSYVTIIPSAHLQTTDCLGQGSGGKVYKATWLDCTFAVKKLNFPETLKSEVGTLIEVSYHPFVVQLIGLYESSSGDYWIVMECMDGNLRKLVEDRQKNWTQKILTLIGRQPEKIHNQNLVIITKIALGMVYLHSKGLVHRDLKPENVLVREYADTIDVKIVDFGESHLEGKAWGGSNRYFDQRGTGFYRAPEVMLKPNFDQLKSESAKLVLGMLSTKADQADQNFDLDALKATDVYSFGMVCYKVLTGDIPYSEDERSESHLKVWNGAELYWPSNLDLLPALKSLVGRCLSLDPAKRPTFEVICEQLDDILNWIPSLSEGSTIWKLCDCCIQ